MFYMNKLDWIKLTASTLCLVTAPEPFFLHFCRKYYKYSLNYDSVNFFYQYICNFCVVPHYIIKQWSYVYTFTLRRGFDTETAAAGFMFTQKSFWEHLFWGISWVLASLNVLTLKNSWKITSSSGNVSWSSDVEQHPPQTVTRHDITVSCFC